MFHSDVLLGRVNIADDSGDGPDGETVETGTDDDPSECDQPFTVILRADVAL